MIEPGRRHARMRIAIVIPWFGEDLKGGAEQHAWQIATRLAARGHHVEVLTTCSRSFHGDWDSNHYEAGAGELGGCIVRRFPVDERDAAAFHRANGAMLSVAKASLQRDRSPVTADDADVFFSNMIRSRALVNYASRHATDWQAILLLPYFYGPIVDVLNAVNGNTYLQPLLHDEVYAYVPHVRKIVHKAKHLAFITEGEYALAVDLYGPGIVQKSRVLGGGVEFDAAVATELPRAVRDQRYVLYLGRRDRTKNVHLIVDAFAEYRERCRDSSLRLVLAGPGDGNLSNPERGVTDLELLDEGAKACVLRHCVALFQPSTNESFSRVIMEAWSAYRPVAAHRDCRATAQAVEAADGGFLAATQAQWAELFARVEEMSEAELAAMGARGNAFVRANLSWDAVIDRYEAFFSNQSPRSRVHSVNQPAIHQLVSNFTFGDAISNHARMIRDVTERAGFRSKIFARHIDPAVADQAEQFSSEAIDERDGLIFHHSIGSILTTFAIRHPGPKCLIYHNITPAEFFAPFRPNVAEILEDGRRQLPLMVRTFDFAAADSLYNTRELQHAGSTAAFVAPVFVDLGRFDVPPESAMIERLDDDRTNLLFVGRIAPNKRQDHLVRAFRHYVALDPSARLILAGNFEAADPYYRYVRELVQRFGLQNHVLITGHISDGELLACYRTSSLFWSMSEHEGFGVPLVESMWFDLPIFAYAATSVPETLGDAGLLFVRKDDWAALARQAFTLTNDGALRARVTAAQRARRTVYDVGASESAIRVILSLLRERMRRASQQAS
jgi:glycosyltransferase involved in cell wall biosynthesis